jgi:hypothetical protein
MTPGATVAELDLGGEAARVILTTVIGLTKTQIITATGNRFWRHSRDLIGGRKDGKRLSAEPLDDVFVQQAIAAGTAERHIPCDPGLSQWEQWFARGSQIVELERFQGGTYWAVLTTVIDITQSQIITATGRRFRRADHMIVGYATKKLATKAARMVYLASPGSPNAKQAIDSGRFGRFPVQP